MEGSAWIDPASASTGESAEEANSEPASSRTGESADEPESHTNCGRFLLNQRWNADQVPLGFASGLDSTWDERGSKRVYIAQPFLGLEKRQFTVQPISPDDKTMRCAIIFRGKGHVSKVEKQAYGKRVGVYFQSHAWADSNFCMQWAGRTFPQGLTGADGQLPAAQSLLLMDNVHGQTMEEFKTYLQRFCNTLPWHLPAGCTDEVPPIDAGYGWLLKVYTGQALDEWLGQESAEVGVRRAHSIGASGAHNKLGGRGNRAGKQASVWPGTRADVAAGRHGSSPPVPPPPDREDRNSHDSCSQKKVPSRRVSM